MNPLFAREVHTRWRSTRSYWLLLGLVFGLSCYFGFLYWTRLDFYERYNQYYAPMGMSLSTVGDLSSVNGRMADLGRALFGSMTQCGCLLWPLLAAVLTAPTVAGEREKGILQELWLSQLTPRDLLWGRVKALVVSLLILQAATLPLMALSFIYGGVSPLEFVLSLLLQALAALCGVAIGLRSSSVAARPTQAVAMACGFILLWACGGEIIRSLVTTVGPKPLAPLEYFSELISLTFPYRTAGALVGDPALGTPMVMKGLPLALRWVGLPILFQLCLSAWMLRAAGQKMLKSLPESRWQRGNPLLSKWRDEARERAAQRQLQKEQHQASKGDAERLLLQEYPLSQYLHFQNPLLEREVRARFRVSHDTAGTAVGRLLGLGGGIMLGVVSVFVGLSSDRMGNFTPVLAGIAGLGGAVGILLQSASSYTRDRENGTWEGVRLTALTNAEIAAAKWAAPQIGAWYFYWPLLALVPLVANHSDSNGIYDTHFSFLTGSLAVLAILGTWSSFSALGCWVSLRSKSTAAATAWTLAAVFLLQVGFAGALSNESTRQFIVPIFDIFIADDGGVSPLSSSAYSPRMNGPRDFATVCFESPVGLQVVYDLTLRPDNELLFEEYSYNSSYPGTTPMGRAQRLTWLRVSLAFCNMLWNGLFTLALLFLIKRRLEAELAGAKGPSRWTLMRRALNSSLRAT